MPPAFYFVFWHVVIRITGMMPHNAEFIRQYGKQVFTPTGKRIFL